VAKYIGLYTNRAAISNYRLIEIDDNDRVHFYYKRYEKREKKLCWYKTSLHAVELIRRFLNHVLPSGFHKIRHYGLLANGHCKKNVQQIRHILGAYMEKKSGSNQTRRPPCPKCAEGRLIPAFTSGLFGSMILNIKAFTQFMRVRGFVYDTS
jgi:hypothetical protein